MENLFDSSSEEEFDEQKKPKKLQKQSQLSPPPPPNQQRHQNQLKRLQPRQQHNSHHQHQHNSHHQRQQTIIQSVKSSKEREILERQGRLAKKLVSTNNNSSKAEVVDLVNVPRSHPHHHSQQQSQQQQPPTQQQHRNSDNKATAQQKLLQKSKQRKVLNSLFSIKPDITSDVSDNHNINAISTRASRSFSVANFARAGGTSIAHRETTKRNHNIASSSSSSSSSSAAAASKRQKIVDLTKSPPITTKSTHIRPKSSLSSSSSSRHPTPSPSIAIEEARKRTTSTISSHKRPLRRATNNTDSGTSKQPQVYNKVDITDYWKNVRNWDILFDLNGQQKQQSQSQHSNNSNNNNRNNKNVSNNANNKNNNNSNRGYKAANATKKLSSSSSSSSDTKNETIIPKTNNNKPKDNNKTSKTPKELPKTFESSRQYKALWAPLVLQENRAQILSDFMEKLNFQFNNNNSMKSSHFINVNVKPVIRDVGNYTDSITLQLSPKEGTYNNYNNSNGNNNNGYMTNDLILLLKDSSYLSSALKGKLLSSSNNNNNNNANQNNNKKLITGGIENNEQNRPSPKAIIGHVDMPRKTVDGLLIKVSRNIWPIVGSTDMLLFRIGQCNVTSLREFTALCGVDTIPLLNDLLGTNTNNASITTSSVDTTQDKKKNNKNQYKDILSLGEGYSKFIQSKYNKSQLDAISASMKQYGSGGFTLVKGPPGTGKTTTLVAILNSLHTNQYNKYYEKVRSIVTKISSTDLTALQNVIINASKFKPRILVCAPSNTAVDNIILKIMEEGFLDGTGRPYKPYIVRVGVGQGVAVKDVGLGSKVDAVLRDSGSSIEKVTVMIKEYKREGISLKIRYKQLRQRIQALELACPWALEKCWEIRINEKTFDESYNNSNKNKPADNNSSTSDNSKSKPKPKSSSSSNTCYFINHNTKKTQFEIPPAPKNLSAETFTASSMPEYNKYLSQLCNILERYLSLHAKIQQLELVQQITSIHSSTNSSDQALLSATRQQLQTHILDQVHIVFSTLGTSGGSALESLDKFEAVVIDEAAQSVEPAILSALQLGSSHAILVGDPQQLPATIFSVSGRGTKYDRSLFQRLEESGLHHVHLLDTQYRMHPEISEFPRSIFYDGNLGDGGNVTHPEYGSPLKRKIFQQLTAFRSFTLLDLDSSEERGGTSLSNSAEAQLAVHLYSTLDKVTSGDLSKYKVAVITPYKEQISVLKRMFDQHFFKLNKKRKTPNNIEIHTVDSYQGKEADIVFFSCVRASGNKTIGFLSDVRRMNVALTRAKHFLFVIARVKSIVVNPYWRELVAHAREKKAVVHVPIIYSSSSSSNTSGGGRNNRGNISFPDLKTLKALPPLPPQEKERISKILNKHQEQMKQKEVINEEEEGELSDFSA